LHSLKIKICTRKNDKTQMNKIKKLIHTIPAGIPSVLIVALDAYLSLASHPVPSSIPTFEGADKVVHFLLYFIITLVFTYDYAKHKFPHHTVLNKELLLMVLAMLLGLVMESMQLGFTEERSFEYYDIVANAAGAATGFGVQRLWLMKRFRHFLGSRRHHHRHRH